MTTAPNFVKIRKVQNSKKKLLPAVEKVELRVARPTRITAPRARARRSSAAGIGGGTMAGGVVRGACSRGAQMLQPTPLQETHPFAVALGRLRSVPLSLGPAEETTEPVSSTMASMATAETEASELRATNSSSGSLGGAAATTAMLL
mmetsp:Transcript_27523/g.74614  ORF Transcript_27523/g.74614 Transcript_27523/m.74614 type:complete len:147 (-) Transcript_27523:661-1101(-)